MSPPARPQTSGCRDPLAVFLLAVVGIATVLTGLGVFELGREREVVLWVLVGFLFLFISSLVLDKNRQRRRTDEVFVALNMLLYGKNYANDREAIRILLRGLSSEDSDVRKKAWKSLKQLTGKDFALDPQVWKSWWQANENHFALRSKRPED